MSPTRPQNLVNLGPQTAEISDPLHAGGGHHIATARRWLVEFNVSPDTLLVISRTGFYGSGARFSKNLMTNLRKTYDEQVIIKKILQKSYENLGRLCKTYEKLTTTLQVSYENVKFVAVDVIREILCQRLLLVEYFELKMTDNQSDDFLRMLSKNDLPFS